MSRVVRKSRKREKIKNKEKKTKKKKKKMSGAVKKENGNCALLSLKFENESGLCMGFKQYFEVLVGKALNSDFKWCRGSFFRSMTDQVQDPRNLSKAQNSSDPLIHGSKNIKKKKWLFSH